MKDKKLKTTFKALTVNLILGAEYHNRICDLPVRLTYKPVKRGK